MNRMDALVARRTRERRDAASDHAERIISAARDKGVDIVLFGSLSRDDFSIHSDIDLLVRGPIDRHIRSLVERLVADELRGADLPYDLVFEADMTADHARELLNGTV